MLHNPRTSSPRRIEVSFTTLKMGTGLLRWGPKPWASLGCVSLWPYNSDPLWSPDFLFAFLHSCKPINTPVLCAYFKGIFACITESTSYSSQTVITLSQIFASPKLKIKPNPKIQWEKIFWSQNKTSKPRPGSHEIRRIKIGKKQWVDVLKSNLP